MAQFSVGGNNLCLSVFAWAPFRSTKADIKLHTLQDLRGNIPSFIHITDGKTHEVNVMDDLVLERGAFYLMDRVGTSVLCNQTGVLSGHLAAKEYPTTIRQVVVRVDTGKRLVLLTNSFSLQPELIADLYRQRWQVKLFFKWIKQHLRIKVFFSTSENAVKTQIWIAISTYLLIAIAKKRLHLDHHSLYEILQRLPR